MFERPTTVRLAVAVTICLLLPLAAGAQVTRPEEIEFPELPPFDVPQPVRVELDNGMILILVEDHELPLIDAVARIRTGQRHDPSDQVGLASLTGDVMRTGGTESMSADEIDKFLEGRAASIETGIGLDSGTASMSCLKEDFSDVLGLFAEVLRHPVFDEDRIAVTKNQINAAIARQNDDSQAIASREFGKAILGADSPYTVIETYTGIAGITRDDLIGFHGRYVHPNNIVLGLVGDFDTETVVAQVTETFGDWPKGSATEPFEGGYRTESAPGVYYVEKNDVTQSSIYMGHLGVRRDDPDYYAIEVFNEVLGGGFVSRLFTRVRSQKGLAYNVRGWLGSNWDRPGYFQLYMTTKTETTGAAIEALILEARNIAQDELPTAEEVDRAKEAILASFVFTSDTASEILGQQLTYEYFGYPLDRLARYVAGIEAVTLEQVQAVGQGHVDPDQFSIVVVGPAEGRDRPLEDFGEVTVLDISIPELEAPDVEVTEETMARGAELLAGAVAAHGGAEAFAGFESVSQKASAVAFAQGAEISVTIDQVVVYADRMRQTIALPQGTMIQVAGPDGAFMQTPMGTQPLTGDRRESLEGGIHRTLPVVLRAATEGLTQAVAAGPSGEAVEYVQVELSGQTFRLGIDSESGLVVQLVYRGSDFTGSPGEVRQLYSDFREVEGLILPFRIDATFEGGPFMNSTIDEAVVNAEVDPSQFVAQE